MYKLEFPLYVVISYIALAIIGILGNFTIILITITNKCLHSRCYILIALMACFNFVYCIYAAQLRVMILINESVMSSSTCFLISIYGIFAMNMQSLLALFIGIDRVYVIVYPGKYAKLSINYYYLMVTLCALISLLVTFCKFVFYSDEVVTNCLLSTALHGIPFKIWQFMNFFITVAVIFVYSLAHINFQTLKKSTVHMKTAKSVDRIMKSMLIVIAFYVCTWTLGLCGMFLSQFLQADDIHAFIIQKLSGWLVLSNSSLNVFIYFWRTPDYRKAILKLFGISKSVVDSRIHVSYMPNNPVAIF